MKLVLQGTLTVGAVAVPMLSIDDANLRSGCMANVIVVYAGDGITANVDTLFFGDSAAQLQPLPSGVGFTFDPVSNDIGEGFNLKEIYWSSPTEGQLLTFSAYLR